MGMARGAGLRYNNGKGVYMTTNAELFDVFFKNYIEEKFPAADLNHPNIKRLEELLRHGFRNACLVKDASIVGLKTEMSEKDTQIAELILANETARKNAEKEINRLRKGLQFYADQKGHALFENDGSKKRTLGDHASKILKEGGE